jgi:hypothetical protein
VLSSKYAEIIRVFSEAENIEFQIAPRDGVDLRPIQGLIKRHRREPFSLGGNSALGAELVTNKMRLFGQALAYPNIDLSSRYEGLPATSIYEAGLYREGLVSDDRKRGYPVNLNIDGSSLALNERPSLNAPNDSKNRSEHSHHPRPAEHSEIKALALLCLSFAGGLLGVWSIVFWDGLGIWKWGVSAFGWITMIACLVQVLASLILDFVQNYPFKFHRRKAG